MRERPCQNKANILIDTLDESLDMRALLTMQWPAGWLLSPLRLSGLWKELALRMSGVDLHL
jgi:hypothetical protein